MNFSLSFSSCHHGLSTLEDRRQVLFFKCECIACSKNYPLFKDMPVADVEAIAPYCSDNIDRKHALEYATLAQCYIERNSGLYPCRQVSLARAYFIDAMRMLYADEIPLAKRMEKKTSGPTH